MRINVAGIFLEAERLMDASEYGQAGIELLEPFGDEARELISYGQQIIRNVVLNLSIRGELPTNETEGGISDQ